MKAKDYLSQGFHIDRRLLATVEVLSTLQRVCEFSSEPAQARARQLLESGLADFESLLDLKQDLARTIRQVDNLQHRLLLEMRYLQGQTWEEVRRALGCTKSRVFRLHKQALQNVDRIRQQ